MWLFYNSSVVGCTTSWNGDGDEGRGLWLGTVAGKFYSIPNSQRKNK
jgi:hypothetical protein